MKRARTELIRQVCAGIGVGTASALVPLLAWIAIGTLRKEEALAHSIEAVSTVCAVLVAFTAIVAPDILRKSEEERNAIRLAREMLGPIANLKWELDRTDLFSRDRQIDWMIAVQQVNIETLRSIPFRFLKAGDGEDDIYFAWVICNMTLQSMMKARDNPTDQTRDLECIAAAQRRAQDRLNVIANRLT